MHLPEDLPGPCRTATRPAAGPHRHAVLLQPDTRLDEIYGGGEIRVNSDHHQAVKSIGSRFRVARPGPRRRHRGHRGHRPQLVLRWRPVAAGIGDRLARWTCNFSNVSSKPRSAPAFGKRRWHWQVNRLAQFAEPGRYGPALVLGLDQAWTDFMPQRRFIGLSSGIEHQRVDAALVETRAADWTCGCNLVHFHAPVLLARFTRDAPAARVESAAEPAASGHAPSRAGRKLRRGRVLGRRAGQDVLCKRSCASAFPGIRSGMRPKGVIPPR